MGKVLYNDGMIAVVDFGDQIAPNFNDMLVKDLLTVTPENVSKHSSSFVHSYEMAVPFNKHASDEPAWANYALSKADMNALESFGMTRKGAHLSPGSIQTLYAISLEATAKEVLRAAEAAQYLCRLCLLSDGDERQSSILPDTLSEPVTPFSEVSFVASMPAYFMDAIRKYSGSVVGYDVPATFDTENVKISNDGRTFYVPVTVDLSALGLTYLCINLGEKPSEGSEMDFYPDLKRLVSMPLLAAIINSMTTARFVVVVDSKTQRLCRSHDDDFGVVLGNAIIEKRIVACPNCGRPVLKLRPSSKPFCKQSHQTRYHEKAKRMLSKGSSVDAVHKEYPYINHKTIAGWSDLLESTGRI